MREDEIRDPDFSFKVIETHGTNATLCEAELRHCAERRELRFEWFRFFLLRAAGENRDDHNAGRHAKQGGFHFPHHGKSQSTLVSRCMVGRKNISVRWMLDAHIFYLYI